MLVRNLSEVEIIPYKEGIEKRVMIGPKQGAPTFAMRVYDLPPGASTPYHAHDWEHEAFVLDGEAVLVTEDGEIAVGAQDAVLIPANEMHCFRNTGEARLRFLCVVPLRGETTP